MFRNISSVGVVLAEAPDYDCFTEPKKLSFNRVVPLKESADKKKIEGKGQPDGFGYHQRRPVESGASIMI